MKMLLTIYIRHRLKPPLRTSSVPYWSAAPVNDGWRIELASLNDSESLLGEILKYMPGFENQTDIQLSNLLFVSTEPVALSQPKEGAIVCSCFSVGDKQIARAIEHENCDSVDAVGRCLGAGTNCGSCRNEIDVLVRQYSTAPQALGTH